MSKESAKKLSAEEVEVVDFLTELIPVLIDIKADLESKNLLDKGFLPSQYKS